ncbi:M1 family metallopeptidase [Zunongwangia sp. HGR-M22]|uniref:M1 family metallopeptidase n=1 Tax=Zunongwangia sp. HGR-M22 TaxID=3015168 RepID=UPI0022DE9691|nr:M1 family metallopeptidase [Zunongwangia sp. HGR-M22]WBL24780.1 M1 family metallopeptidase [Zunongwangia sp. HGR-M22]
MKKIFFSLIILNAFFLKAQSISSDNQIEFVDFKTVNAEISIYPEATRVEGNVNYEFEVLKQVDSIFIDAENMSFREVLVNGEEADFRLAEDKIWIKTRLDRSKENKLQLKYSVSPKQTMYFINWDQPDSQEISKQVWTQGQGRYTSHWLPSFDDMREKTVFNLKINFNKNYKVIANGKLENEEMLNDSVKQWSFSMKEPMSSYLVAVAAGNYESTKLQSAGGIPISLFYETKDENLAEPTYRYSKKIFDFLVNEIGVEFPWQNYKQIPVEDFLYAGMENTGATIFSESMLTDSIGFKDQNYVNVNAHELAHQWFGDLVTETEGKHHWLHEGFATYYALLTEKQLFGEDYYYWKLYETAEQLKKNSDRGEGEALLNPKASSLTFYQKGAWALHILREKLGDEAFKTGVRNYLKLYSFKNVTTDNFLAEMENVSGQDLTQFKEDWLEQSAFKANAVLNSLKQSAFIRRYLDIAAVREQSVGIKYNILNGALDFPVNDYIGQEAVMQLQGNTSQETIDLYKKAFETGNIFVRQTIASSMKEIPKALKSEYEDLLNDDSYLTKEYALMTLWTNFPEERSKYLSKTKNIEGFYNKNVRMLWLTLNLVTPEFDAENSQKNYAELSGYTQTKYPFEIRQNAFSYLFQIDAFSDQNLKDLMQGTQHHTYRFRDYCRQLLKEILTHQKYRKKLQDLSNSFSEKEQQYLQSQL